MENSSEYYWIILLVFIVFVVFVFRNFIQFRFYQLVGFLAIGLLFFYLPFRTYNRLKKKNLFF